MQAGRRQLQALAHAQRERNGVDVGHIGQVELLQGRIHRLPALRAFDLVQARVQLQVLAHAQLFVQREGLRHIAHAHARLNVASINGFAQQFDCALGRFQQTGEHFHGGGFAAAVGAEKAENLALVDAKAHVVHRREAAKPLGQAMRLDRGRQMGVWHKRRDCQPARALLLFGRQHADVGLFQRSHAMLGHYLARGLAHQQPAFIHGKQILEVLGLFDVGRSHHHGHARAFGLQFVHQGPELAARQRVDTRGRLIQNQYIGRMHQGAAQAQFLLHAARQFACRPARKRRQPRGLQQPRNPRLALGRIQAKQAGMKVHILVNAQRRVQVMPQALRHVGDLVRQRLPRFPVCHIAAQYADRAGLNHAHARNQRQQRGFAHAVRADQPDGNAARNAQRYIMQSLHLAVAVRYGLDDDCGFRSMAHALPLSSHLPRAIWPGIRESGLPFVWRAYAPHRARRWQSRPGWHGAMRAAKNAPRQAG